MAMEIKSTDEPLSMQLHDETGHIGDLLYVDPDEDDPADTTEGWVATLRGLAGGQTEFYDTAPEAFAAALPLYEQLVEQRRTVERFHRNQPVHMISTPMGGQPR
jgi:hypothetical protein